MGQSLAVTGGAPVATIDWPVWPRPVTGTDQLVADVLGSGRWALSGPWKGRRSHEQEFARRFAAYNEVEHCVPTANGTSALVIALEALGVGAGDEVIVPGLTWVASASAVLNVNAVPVIVDIDPATLCLDPAAVEAAITARTRAINVVHLYSSMADMDAILAIGARHGVPVLEDCAQAHGARWRGRRAGSLGRVGTFSMQQTKLLTAGEGGAAITGDPDLFDAMFQLRADGRRLAPQPPGDDRMELIERSSLMGNNYCLSEFGAAVLLSGLEVLDKENEIRAANAARLTARLREVPGVDPIRRLPGVTGDTYYQYAVRVDPEAFAARSAGQVCRAVEMEIGFPVSRCYPPLNRNPLYQPLGKRRYLLSDEHRDRIDPSRFELPNAERASAEVLTFHHSLLLARPADVDVVAEAFAKVRRLAASIPAPANGTGPAES
ncbi:DegT/DnrJ/EryC1/StrS family aminotransferase [Actinomadura monticuli]|uniref:DegT/DnrJ/EryC1/StrS family aminotransferase n=1 Tax=Actinomadura monticuli TaxID=3097367 RepID=A0ABV4Q712_9ACTN